MTQLAPKQQEVYDYILKHYKNYQTLPNKREIQHGMSFKSYNSVKVAIDAMIKKGWLEVSLSSVGYKVTSLSHV